MPDSNLFTVVALARRLGLSTERLKAEAEAGRVTQEEVKAWETAHLQEMAKLERDSYKQDVDERKKYAKNIFCLVCAWLAGVLLVVVAGGMKFEHFQISDKVVLSVVAGTTVDVLGLFFIVANYLFPRKTAGDSRITCNPVLPHAGVYQSQKLLDLPNDVVGQSRFRRRSKPESD